MKNLIIYIITAALVYLAVSLFITEEQVAVLKAISVKQILISVIIAFCIFTVSGHQFSFILKERTGTTLSIFDRTAFPVSRNLWSYLIPFQGSFAYALVFIKFKYKVDLKKGISINLFLLLFNFFFTGIIGIFIYFTSRGMPKLFLILTVLFTLFPLASIICERIISRLNIRSRYVDILKNITSSVSEMWKDLEFSLKVFLFNILHTAVTVLWFYWTVIIFDLELSFIPVIFLALILKISLIFRITPGNLGVEQLIYGGIFSLMSLDPNTGVLLSLFHKSITLVISMLFGTAFTAINLKYFSIDNIKRAINRNYNEIN